MSAASRRSTKRRVRQVRDAGLEVSDLVDPRSELPLIVSGTNCVVTRRRFIQEYKDQAR
jgi:hypothetical protein